MISKVIRINNLMDIYSALLTDKQRAYMYDYYNENFSLAEISETYGLSRQTIYDTIKRAEMIFEEYESKLKLLEKKQRRTELFNELNQYLTTETFKEKKIIVSKLEELENIN